MILCAKIQWIDHLSAFYSHKSRLISKYFSQFSATRIFSQHIHDSFMIQAVLERMSSRTMVKLKLLSEIEIKKFRSLYSIGFVSVTKIFSIASQRNINRDCNFSWNYYRVTTLLHTLAVTLEAGTIHTRLRL